MLLLHNKVNLDVLRQGLTTQSIELTENKVIITAVNKRIATLSVLDSIDKMTSRAVEVVLENQLKNGIRNEIKSQFNLEPQAIFKDYDPHTEISVCIILFSKNVLEIVNQLD